MKIISLSSIIAGPACSIAHCIKKHFYSNSNFYPTGMFDYLEISMKTINQILENNNVEDGLVNNYYIYTNKDNKSSIKLNNFDHLISHHDLSKNYNEEDLNNFFEKYKRRYKRLIYDLENEDKIFFIRYGLDDYNLITNFINKIKKINSKLEIYFINVIYDEINNINEIFHNNYILINFNNYIDKSKTYSNDFFFKLIDFDWTIIYKIIYDKLSEIERNNIIYV
jgi:hypothetical protein